jgi:hypothetical protein
MGKRDLDTTRAAQNHLVPVGLGAALCVWGLATPLWRQRRFALALWALAHGLGLHGAALLQRHHPVEVAVLALLARARPAADKGHEIDLVRHQAPVDQSVGREARAHRL